MNTKVNAAELLAGTTPGPWTYNDGREGDKEYFPHVNIGPAVHFDGRETNYLTINDCNPGGDMDLHRANARLIAAAPALAARVVELEKRIAEIEWLCDGREDIDGNGGPNLAMQIMQALRGQL